MSHADTLDHALHLLARARRVLDDLAEEIRYDGPTLRVHSGIAAALAAEIAAFIGHSVTDHPEAPEMFALREFIGEADDGRSKFHEEGRRIERNAWLKALDDSNLPTIYRRLVRDLALAPCDNCGGDAAICDCDES